MFSEDFIWVDLQLILLISMVFRYQKGDQFNSGTRFSLQKSYKSLEREQQ